MKITFTADCHLDFLSDPVKDVEKFAKHIMDKEEPDVFCIGGDMLNSGLSDNPPSLHRILSFHPETLFVLGNHDLWSDGMRGRPKLNPDDALVKYQEKFFKWGIPLEKSSVDLDTIYRKENCVFVGAMGFPDFKNPKLTNPVEYYDRNGCTNDLEYIKLSLGWLHYTLPMQEAFFARLDKALSTDAKNIIVITHCGIFETQCHFTGEHISAYFFNHTMGQHILDKAKEHPDKKFWCLSGHSHEYCRGVLKMEAENVYAFGLSTYYEQLSLMTFDPDLDINQDWHRLVIVDRQTKWMNPMHF